MGIRLTRIVLLGVIAICIGLIAQKCNQHASTPTYVLVAPPILSYETQIVAESLTQGISAALPLAVAYSESRMQQWAIHRNNARSFDLGLFQLNTRTIKVLHVTHPFDVRQNIIAGVGLLALYERVCGSEHGAYMAFRYGHCPTGR
jgi:hypothetical protein